ncbi:MAG: pyridoxal-phosphate dependent enzyme [Deltaproteobacteria bacterium]|nr:pyridoxal-phosphate dependent enzyme [Deltaproteobacteria bacterium]
MELGLCGVLGDETLHEGIEVGGHRSDPLLGRTGAGLGQRQRGVGVSPGAGTVVSERQATLSHVGDLAGTPWQPPRCGFLEQPSPLLRLPAGAVREAGEAAISVKRDDLLPGLHGGTKVRKLDLLLASPPFDTAAGWVSMGAIGSGHVLGLAEAARERGVPLTAYLFDEPYGPHVEENLAALASCGKRLGAALRLVFVGSRAGLLLRPPWPLLRRTIGGAAVVPPGATLPRAMVGTVLGGLELARQIDAGELEPPDRIYLPVGTGGTAVGIALGLGLGGRPIPVHAVAVVEHLLLPARRLRALEGLLRRELAALGTPGLEGLEAAPLVLRRGYLGRGYGHVTPEGLAACAALADPGARLALEPIYTGKAAAALLEDARAGATRRPLLWNTHRGVLPAPEPGWREHLPPALRGHLAHPGRGRRRFLVTAGVGAAGLLGAGRLACTGRRPGFGDGSLTAREATIFAAAVQALLPPAPIEELVDRIVAAADAYVATFPQGRRLEVHGMLFAVEQAPLLEGHLSRFSELPLPEASAYLAALRARPDLLGDAGRGLRDLCLLATYTRPEIWEAIGYTGPWEQRPLDAPPPLEARRGPYADYADLRASEGESPEGWS